MVPVLSWLLAFAPGLLAAPLALPATTLPRLVALRTPPAALRLQSLDFTAEELRRAAAIWQHGCARLGSPALPELRLAGPGVPVTVRRVADSTSANGRCGRTRLRVAEGRLQAAEIDVFARQRGGTSCFPLADELAHELGHVMGLADSADAELGSMMGSRSAGTRRAPTAAECQAVAAEPHGNGMLLAAATPASPSRATGRWARAGQR